MELVGRLSTSFKITCKLKADVYLEGYRLVIRIRLFVYPQLAHFIFILFPPHLLCLSSSLTMFINNVVYSRIISLCLIFSITISIKTFPSVVIAANAGIHN